MPARARQFSSTWRVVSTQVSKAAARRTTCMALTPDAVHAVVDSVNTTLAATPIYTLADAADAVAEAPANTGFLAPIVGVLESILKVRFCQHTTHYSVPPVSAQYKSPPAEDQPRGSGEKQHRGRAGRTSVSSIPQSYTPIHHKQPPHKYSRLST